MRTGLSSVDEGPFLFSFVSQTKGLGRDPKEIEFNRVFEELHKKVFNLSLQYVFNTEDAAEITQDVFLSVYDKLETFKGESSLSTWVYRITINKSLDFLKAKNRQKRSFLRLFKSDEEAMVHVPVHFNHPGIEVEDKEQLEILMRQIHLLPESQKTAIVLLRIEGMSTAEVAEIMNISQKALESLFQRAKTNLKKLLTEDRESANPLSSK